MQRPRALYLVLAFIAFAGWLLFILACTGWPGWSPDGKQIAFPYYDLKADAIGIAVYDREQKTTTEFYLTQQDDTLATAQWSRDGKQILLYRFFGTDDRFATEVLSIPVKDRYPIRSYGVTSKVMGDNPPLAEVNGTLYLALDGITALDLNTWHTQHESISNYGLILFTMGDRLLYIAGPKKEEDKKPGCPDASQQPAAQKPPEKAATEKEEPPTPLEFGEVDRKDLSRHAWFTITDQQISDLAKCKADLLIPPVANTATERMAFTAACDGKPDALLVLDRNGVSQLLRPKAEGNLLLTNPEWSRDGKNLYAGLYVRGDNNQKAEYSIAEIALDTQAVRLTPVARLDVSGGDYHDGVAVSLSPDGSMLATNLALIRSESEIDRDDMALYVVDLRDPQRAVTKVHPPNWEPKPPEESKPAPAKKSQ
jgi:hypothetical protein